MRNPRRRATRGTRYASAAASALLCAVLLVGIAGLRGNAQTPDALPYSTGYLVTGNYVVGGVDFTPLANPPDGSGLATGTIHMRRRSRGTRKFSRRSCIGRRFTSQA